MITFPIKYLRVLLLAVVMMRKAKAVAANIYKRVQIGTGEDASIYDLLVVLESDLKGLIDNARIEKHQGFSIVLGGVHAYEPGVRRERSEHS